MSNNPNTLDNNNQIFSSENYDYFYDAYENMRFLISPKKIFDFLNARVFKMDEAKKALAMFVFKAIKKRSTCEKVLLLAAESGTGKSYLISVLSEIVPNLIVIDGSSLVPQGYRGTNHLVSALSQLNMEYNEPGFVVIDEFNRTLQKGKGSWADSSLLSELLILFDGKEARINISSNDAIPRWISTSQLFFILLGSFSDMTDQQQNTGKIGFNVSYETSNQHRTQITQEQILESLKAWPELIGRINRIVVSPNLSESDYFEMLTDSQYSPINQLEDELDLTIKLSQKKIKQLAKEAYESGTGVRCIKNKILEQIDEKMFENPSIKKVYIR